MSGKPNYIDNDISRAVLDYISENEKEKQPTKNIAKVGQALSLVRDLLENHTKTDRSDLLSVAVSYGETDVTLTISLPLDWSFDKKALKIWRSLLNLADGMFHQTGNVDDNGFPIDYNLCFIIRKVFEEKAD